MSVPKRSISHCCRYFTYLSSMYLSMLLLRNSFGLGTYLVNLAPTTILQNLPTQYPFVMNSDTRVVCCILRKIIHRRLPQEDPDGSSVISFQISFHHFFMSINYDSTTNFHLEMSQFLQFTNPIINGIFLLSLQNNGFGKRERKKERRKEKGQLILPPTS